MKQAADTAPIVVHWTRTCDGTNRGETFRLKLENSIESRPSAIIIDLDGVDSIGPMEIGSLVAAQYFCDERQIRMVIHNMLPVVSKTLSSVSMLGLFEIGQTRR